MIIHVCQHNATHDTVKRTGAKHVLSITDVGNHLYLTPRLKKCNILKMQFDDVILANAAHAPTVEQVDQMLSWARKIPANEDLVVHCWAGISRSSAIAIAIHADRYGKIDEAIQHIKHTRPLICPNPVISKYADELLGADGRLHDACEEVAEYRLLTQLAGDIDNE